MNKENDAKSRHRPYTSALRVEQARATRERLLDAVEARLEAGDGELSYATLAREARVSIPTVYRHFPTREALFEAIFARTEQRSPPPPSITSEGLRSSMEELFARFDDPARTRASRLHTLWEFSRAQTVPRRRAWFEAYVEAHLPGLPEPTRSTVVDLAVVLVSSAMAEAFRGYLDRPAADAAASVQFAIDALITHAASLHPEVHR